MIQPLSIGLARNQLANDEAVLSTAIGRVNDKIRFGIQQGQTLFLIDSGVLPPGRDDLRQKLTTLFRLAGYVVYQRDGNYYVELPPR